VPPEAVISNLSHRPRRREQQFRREVGLEHVVDGEIGLG